MSANDKTFTGSIPDIYDDHLVPLIFEVYADDLARRVMNGPAQDVLETAAGSGVVARALAPLLAKDARYIVSDLNPPMLTRAQNQQPADARIQWQQADALALPFKDDQFDVVVCQFGAMFFPDKPSAYDEARRVLRPDGRFIFNMWDHIRHNEFAEIVTRVAGELLPDDPPNFLARTPHGHHDTDQIYADLLAAGYSNIDIETVTETSTAKSAAGPAIAYAQGTPLRNEIEKHGAEMLNAVTLAAAAEIKALYGAGPVSAKIQGFVITAS